MEPTNLLAGLEQAATNGIGAYPMAIMATGEQAVTSYLSRLIVEEEGEEALVRAPKVTELLDRIKKDHAFDPGIFDEMPPFLWDAHISNNGVDAYFTRMAKSSLQNYATEADAGVSFQNSHNTRELPLGRSIWGRFFGAQRNGVSRVEATFYTLPGLRINGVNTDEFVRGVRAGIIRDVSIGFYGGEYRCNLCGRDMLRDWSCWHIPGFKYVKRANPDAEEEWVPAREGDKATETAIASIENAHLAEVSAVYEGATPGAAILKAYQQAESGRLAPEMARAVELRYRIAIPGTQRPWVPRHQEQSMSTPGPASPPTPGPAVPPPVTPPPVPTTTVPTPADRRSVALDDPQWRQLVAALSEAGLQNIADGDVVDLTAIAQSVRALANDRGTHLARVRELEQTVRDLEPVAAEGREYRQELVREALEAGVRAFGDHFQQATYEQTLTTAPLAFVRQMRNDWRTIGDQTFKGGRETAQTAEPPEQAAHPAETRNSPHVPDELHRP